MAKVKNISGETRNVPELGWRNVEHNEIVDIPDERLEAFTCQQATWRESKGGK